ncbi:MAG: M6 family metalloprotease domain-containing protein, partial [Candidatus Aminicenantes bacterium]|nr:M6 family metalloprotease domain-containing protein [Candidatus Aminicenantes bacterium]
MTMKPLSRSSGRGPTACSVGSLIVIAAIVFLSSFAQAAYLINVPQTLRQPDGEILRCLASGDEYFNWLHDAAGYTIIQDPRTGYYVYAEPAPGGEIRASGLIAGRINPAAAGLARGVQPAASSRSRLIAATRRRQAAADPTPAPKTGTINNLVVFIRFQGESEFTDAPSVFTQMLNGAGAADNSMLGYFREASYNRLTVQSTLYPTPGATVLSYLDANARGYYQPYNAVSNPTGYTGGDNGADRMNREHTLLKNAVSAVAAQVPAGLIVDGDGDGLVDNIVFVVSGSPTGWASLLWPHQWALYSQYAYINGKRVYTYNLQLRTTTGTGVLCHEMCHSIGLPDLYHYSDNGIDPVGRWDVMEWDANPPQHMGAFMKWRYTGWIASLPEITAAGTYTLSPLTTSTGNCYKIRSPNSATEYFVLEYRRRAGTFEASLPGDGLLVYRINSARDGQGNASGPPDEVYIYRPDGTTSANGLVNSAAYSSAAGRTTINDTTNPSSFLSSGGAGGLRILNVGSAGSTISFDVRFP